MAKPNDPPEGIEAVLSKLAREDFCYVTTTGRVTGRPHEIEIWFGAQDRTLYLLSGGGDRSDWVRNMCVQPSVNVRIGKHSFTGTARAVTDKEQDALARRLLAAKYQRWREGRKMSEWALTALPMAIDIRAD